MKTFSFGYLPDPPDHRDYKLKSFTLTNYPSSVDLGEFLQPIKNQGTLGACTAFATTAMVEYVRNKQKLLTWDASPLFTYYSTRKIENTIDIDSGAYVRDALKSVVDDGVAKETTWPYVVENFTTNPPTSAWEEAEKHQALVYYRLDQTKEQILGCLSDGYPFTFGAYLYESFIKTQTGFLIHNVVPMPNKNSEKLIGGHCMLAVGYLSASESNITISVRNSWGTDVGLGGYHNIPLNYFLDPTLSMDFWTIRSEERTDEDPSPLPPKPEPINPPAPPKPEPINPPAPPEPVIPPDENANKSIWKSPLTYFMLLFALLTLIFCLL